tara:strand:+ start:1748 stop:1930 length:183 start_codon:yes stop_codon:yes gene_type:complete
MENIIINNKTNIKLNNKELSILKLVMAKLIQKNQNKTKIKKANQNLRLNKWKNQQWKIYR